MHKAVLKTLRPNDADDKENFLQVIYKQNNNFARALR